MSENTDPGRIIGELINRGTEMNNNIKQKIASLEKGNQKFNEELSNRLQNIISAITKFRSTNLAELTQTKSRLESVTAELETTRQQLVQTQNELQTVNERLAASQNELNDAKIARTALEQQITDLETNIADKTLQHENNIREINAQTERNNEELQRNFNAQIEQLNSEKANLEKAAEEARQRENNANKEVNTLRTNQQNLIVGLGQVNGILSEQLALITSINTEQPNITPFNQLLGEIENGLQDVMRGIKDAVNTSVIQPVSNKETDFLYTKFISLDDNKQQEILNKLYELNDGKSEYAEKISNLLSSGNPSVSDKQTIHNILSRRYLQKLGSGDKQLLGGRKQKHRTMKKRPRRTRKLMKKRQKGGYTYSASKKLNDASSVISNSSRSNYGSKSRTTRSNKKSKRRFRKQI